MCRPGLTSVVGPSFQAHFIIAFLPDEDGPGLDVSRSFQLVQAAYDRSQHALSYCLKDSVRVPRIADMKTGVSGTLGVLCGCVKHVTISITS